MRSVSCIVHPYGPLTLTQILSHARETHTSERGTTLSTVLHGMHLKHRDTVLDTRSISQGARARRRQATEAAGRMQVRDLWSSTLVWLLRGHCSSLLLDAVDIAAPAQPSLLHYLARDPVPPQYHSYQVPFPSVEPAPTPSAHPPSPGSSAPPPAQAQGQPHSHHRHRSRSSRKLTTQNGNGVSTRR